MEEESEDHISGLTFAAVYTRIADLIGINGDLLVTAQWLEKTAGPVFRTWLDSMAKKISAKFPAFPIVVDPAAEVILDRIASEHHRNAVWAVNAATLVFGHSITDSAVDDLLEISARGVPERWRIDQEEFTVKLEELRRTTVDDYTKKVLDRAVKRQKAKSLPAKVQYLFTISECGPDTFGLKLDTNLLREADVARHEIVHGSKFDQPTERLHAMLDTNLFAAQAALFAVAQSCGYRHVIDHTGIVFNPI